MENLKDPFEARLSKDWSKLDDIAKRSYKKPNKESENERCKSVICCISKYDSNINWIECAKCLNWVHCQCEGIFSQGISLSDDADFQCLRCQSYITEDSIWNYFVAKSKENSERQRKLELDIAELKSHCEALKDSIDSNIGDYERQLLETLDRIKVVRQAYHGNVFIGNHCKIILKNYEKLCDVVSDEPEFHEHISECFRIYSELDKLISAKRFLTETEINTVKSLCTGFGNFTKYFPNENISRKIHELIFDVPRFLAKHKTLGYLSEEECESVHHSINKQLQQYQSVRDEGEKLQLVITNEELLSTADRRLADVKPRPKCDSCKVYLRKGLCPQCHKKAK